MKNWIFDREPEDINEYLVILQHKRDKKPHVTVLWYNEGWIYYDGDELMEWLEVLGWAEMPEVPQELYERLDRKQ